MAINFSDPTEVGATISGLAGLSIRMFEHARGGEIIFQDARGTLSDIDRAIMARVSAHALDGGDEDIASSIHDLLALMTTPFSSWPIRHFRNSGPAFENVSLIEPVTLVPSIECQDIAACGTSVEAAMEEALFSSFMDALERHAGSRAPQAYSFIRELVSRNPLIEEAVLLRSMDDAKFSSLYSEVRNLYDHAHHTPGHAGEVITCAHCRSPMAAIPLTGGLNCPLRQCRDQKPHAEAPPVAHSNILLAARPAILTFWVGPGQDELAVHDAALAAGKASVLYDKLDSCDILVSGDVAIDVKSYRSPIMLAEKFNRDGIGGLRRYTTRVLSVSDDLVRADPAYIATFNSHLEKSLGMEVLSVSETIRKYVNA